jgi:hypothetical protein
MAMCDRILGTCYLTKQDAIRGNAFGTSLLYNCIYPVPRTDKTSNVQIYTQNVQQDATPVSSLYCKTTLHVSVLSVPTISSTSTAVDSYRYNIL